MSAPALVVCAAAALACALPIVGAASVVETAHRASGAADAAALAAADAATGWLDGTPCAIAGEVARANGSTLVRCSVRHSDGQVRVVTSVTTILGAVTGRAHAGPPS